MLVLFSVLFLLDLELQGFVFGLDRRHDVHIIIDLKIKSRILCIQVTALVFMLIENEVTWEEELALMILCLLAEVLFDVFLQSNGFDIFHTDIVVVDEKDHNGYLIYWLVAFLFIYLTEEEDLAIL